MRAKKTQILINLLFRAVRTALLKTAMAGDSHRGFESHALRIDLVKRQAKAGLS
jgi:hypothetical protein